MKTPEMIVWERCMALKKDERALVVYDENKKDIAFRLLQAAEAACNHAMWASTPVAFVNGEEPSADAAKAMLEHDVIVICTTMSISHTKARRDAKRKGARIASMPGITEEMMGRAIDVDYEEMNRRAGEIVKAFGGAKSITIKTGIGMNLTLERGPLTIDTGLYHNRSDFGNLPAGEVSFAPIEGTAEGNFAVDLTMAGVGRLKDPIRFTARKGMVASIEGGDDASALKGLLDKIGDDRAYNIAEVGIGTNDRAVISGKTLEDEKVLGTIHIALGNNMSFANGTVDAPAHLDGVICKPTIIADGKVIIKEGVFPSLPAISCANKNG